MLSGQSQSVPESPSAQDPTESIVKGKQDCLLKASARPSPVYRPVASPPSHYTSLSAESTGYK